MRKSVLQFFSSSVLPLVLVSIFLFPITKALAGTITLRVIAVNPSEETEQAVPIKVYLPVEVKPEDIIYKEDLGVAYDTQQGSYYVFGDYTLQPTEVLEKEIEIKDIWMIDEVQLGGLRKETQEIFDSFKKAGFADKASFLYDGIDKKLKEIEEMQTTSANNPSQHISNYRYCLSLLNGAKADLLAAKTLLAEIGPKGLGKLTWQLIVFIIVFLGALGLGFFVIWQRQAKIETQAKPPSAEEELGHEENKEETES